MNRETDHNYGQLKDILIGILATHYKLKPKNRDEAKFWRTKTFLQEF